MIESADYGSITLVTIQNPPVNAMSPGVPAAIMDAVRDANARDDCTAIVLRGGGKGNIAGADIRFQGNKWPEDQPTLRDLIVALEDSNKPVVAALGPNTLGGGLELAMACAYRVIGLDGKVGQPEVTLGIPPGAGATQRLPRLVGAEMALTLIVGGKPVSASVARESGLVDAVFEGDLVDGAVEFARHIEGGHQRTRDRSLDPYRPELFAAQREMANKLQPGLLAPQACIDCVEAAYRLSFDEGLAYERERFEVCVSSDQAAALRHAFFAERQAGKVRNVSEESVPANVESIAVIGAGTMGSGIAIALLKAGYQVTLIEANEEALARGLGHIRKTLGRDVERGRMSGADRDSAEQGLATANALDAAADADLVIEAVFEDMSVKQEIFAGLSRIASKAILATNTSYLDVNRIAESARDSRDRILGMHFFSPANLMKLLEVVRGDATSDEALLTAMAVGKRIGKFAIVAGVCHGFIGNRMYQAYQREANFLLEEGALPAQVDAALTDFGFAMGPFAVSDLAGLDIGWANRKATAATRDSSLRYGVVADRICERGWFGQKSGRGFYRYEAGSRKPIVDPEITALIGVASRDLGIKRREVSDQEIIERCVYAVINEGGNILEEGIAQKASDLDVAWIHGYGFPRWRGGPMFYAAQVGLTRVLARIQELDAENDFWKPSALLSRIEASGGSLYD